MKNKSINEILELVEKGNVDAIYELAIRKHYGYGMKKDYNEAFNLFKNAAEKQRHRSICCHYQQHIICTLYRCEKTNHSAPHNKHL